MRRRPLKPAGVRGTQIGENALLINADCLEALKLIPDNSIDSCVVDGPYNLSFMGSDWDSFTEETAKSAGGFGKYSETNENAYAAARVRYDKDLAAARAYQEFTRQWASEVLRVLKPGGFLLSMGGTRTQHRMVCGIEDAGFEVRDMVAWVYATGFPKSHDVSKAIDRMQGAERTEGARTWIGGKRTSGIKGRNDGTTERVIHDSPASPDAEIWDGWGTALKPAMECVCMARKPLSEKSVAANVLKWGTGAINIDACRINRTELSGWHKTGADGSRGFQDSDTFRVRPISAEEIQARCTGGRWPANLILDEEAGALLDAQSGKSKSGNLRKGITRNKSGNVFTSGSRFKPGNPLNTQEFKGDSGGASRFFFCPKPSKSERDAGLEEFAEQAWTQFQTANGTSGKASSISEGRNTTRRNGHPTVKPIGLMAYLIRLVTPPGGMVLDCFMGSGTTGVAAIWQGFRFLGIERDTTRGFFQIATARIQHAIGKAHFHAEAAKVGYEGPESGYRKFLQTKTKKSGSDLRSSNGKRGVSFKRRRLQTSNNRTS